MRRDHQLALDRFERAQVRGGLSQHTLRRRLPWAAGVADRPDRLDERPGYLFFTAEEAAFIEAAVARLIPKDELGPGALEAGVPRFIDRQLAGPYGQGDHFNLQRPMPKGTPTQGWQMGAPDVIAAAIEGAVAAAAATAPDVAAAAAALGIASRAA